MSDGTAEETSEKGRPEPMQQDVFNNQNARWWDGGEKPKVGEQFETRRLNTPLDEMMRKQGGRRSQTHTSQKRGRYIQARPSAYDPEDLAFDATLRAAAPYQKQREEQRKLVAFAIRPNDYMRKIRVKRAANLVLFLVDASWSMAVSERMTATKGAILSLLTDAYQRRDRVGLIVFQKDHATQVLPPTNSVALAQKVLADIPVGGKTPLAAGLQMAMDTLHREQYNHPDVMPLLIVLTDGAGNVSMGNLSPMEEAYNIADLIAIEQIHSLVINMEHAAFDQGLAQVLADHLGSPCFTITDLKAESLYRTVRREMMTGKSPEGMR